MTAHCARTIAYAIVGLLVGWVMGTVAYFAMVSSYERETERRIRSVQNHPSRRNRNNSSVDSTLREYFPDDGFNHISSQPSTLQDWSAWYRDIRDYN